MKHVTPIMLSLICITLLCANAPVINATTVNLDQKINYSQLLPTVSRNDTLPLTVTSQMISTLTNAVYSATNGAVNLTIWADGTGRDLTDYINATFTIILNYTISPRINLYYNAKLYLPDDSITDFSTGYLTLTADQTKKIAISTTFQAEIKLLSNLTINLPMVNGYVFSPLAEANEIQLPKSTLVNIHLDTGLDSQLGAFNIPLSDYLKNYLTSLRIPPIAYTFNLGNGTNFGNITVGIQPNYQLDLYLNSVIKATPWLTAGQGLTTGLTFSPSNLNFTYTGESKQFATTVETPGNANLSLGYDQYLDSVLNLNVSGVAFAISTATTGISQSFISSAVTAQVVNLDLGTANATVPITGISLLAKVTSPFTWQNLGLLIIGLVVGYFIGVAVILVVFYRRRKRRFQQAVATTPSQGV